MIKLNIREYCQDCTDFDPEVAQRPAQIASLSGDTCMLGDTIVECEHRRHCEALYNHLKNTRRFAKND